MHVGRALYHMIQYTINCIRIGPIRRDAIIRWQHRVGHPGLEMNFGGGLNQAIEDQRGRPLGGAMDVWGHLLSNQ